MKILVANIGSTSLKWRLFDFANGAETLLHKGGLERVTDYPQAIEECLRQLQQAGAIRSEADLAAVGFKTVIAKGVTGCVRLDDRVLAAMEAYNGLAPAHNPPYLTGIRLFARRIPQVPLVGLFETAFYQFAPEPMMRYAVPDAWHDIGVRRWGFHGASHKFIAERSAELLGRPDIARRAQNLYRDGAAAPAAGAPLRVISCHLGGSSSITGILNGVAIGNSLGMSPQSGLPHNNRVGDLDAEALPYAVKTLGLSLEEAQRQLSKEGGLKGLSGGHSNDVRDLQEAADRGDAKARLALDVLVSEARRWIGGYFLQLNGADAPAPGAPLRVISCHLGGSSSITGILNGVAIGNSLGMSPQSGLPHNNRVGDLDAEALPYAVKTLGLTVEEAQRQLSKEGGLKGLSGGLSNDVRDLQEAADRGDAKARLALAVLVSEARRWIGGYFLQLNGADALVFTAGIGENRAGLRAAICAHLDQLGIVLDPARNEAARATETVISAPGSRVQVLVIPTNEELVVARETRRLLEASRP